MTAAPTVVVTRPAAQAADWVGRLAAHGIDAVALPLIEIDAAADPAAVHVAWAALPRCALAVFVSPNAVQQFFAAHGAGAAVVWPPRVRAGSTGAGTSRALRAAGVPQAQLVEPPADAPQFDSEALWARLQDEDWTGRQVLIVRGDGGRDWLGDTLRARGACIDTVAAYGRRAPLHSAALGAQLAALSAQPGAIWLFSSSQAIAHLEALVPGADWSTARAIATHPRIVERARAAGFGRVTACRPEFDDVIACIQSIETRPAP